MVFGQCAREIPRGPVRCPLGPRRAIASIEWSAVKALATVQKLQRPSIQVNIADKQVNGGGDVNTFGASPT
ncbi:hypothetical protein IAD21_00198 [Abditibacteriota bacterium]|nr:hypothetical protein IAD21_00198 [Abditibacteriota bacterium]